MYYESNGCLLVAIDGRTLNRIILLLTRLVRMAYRGRGRGGFGGRGPGSYAKEVAFDIFPEIEELPDVNLKQKDKYEELVSWSYAFQRYWIKSCYHLGPGQDSESKEKDPMSDYIKMTDEYVPAELASKNVKRSNKKVRWDPQSDFDRFDFFEKQDQRLLSQDDDEKEKKEDDEEDDEDNENIEEEEDDSGDDYDQNIDFDDDEDDFNMNDDFGDDEGCY
ncbi:hypothetical protein QVD17_18099 [Tagetes erecta]|uniref:DNA-directed RNA polymerase III subunit n=1 Tax=Tagetes erecta TaxID=13708 RepID=A0AAD8KH51_TARER|nr:hypothetical protein QVD17_18099 [Tagetes erecta]